MDRFAALSQLYRNALPVFPLDHDLDQLGRFNGALGFLRSARELASPMDRPPQFASRKQHRHEAAEQQARESDQE